MQRLHLVELEDLPWVPAALKDPARDLLDLGFDRARFYAGLLPGFRAFLDTTGTRDVVDLASGGGGGVLSFARALRGAGVTGTRFILTDRYPNAGAAERVHALGDPLLRYHPSPVDALSSVERPAGTRTMFGALHHFQPEQVTALVTAAIRERQPFAFVDVAANDKLRALPAFLFPLAALPNLLMLLVVTLLLVPLLRPVRLRTLLLTYVLPLLPLLVAWDGTVSAVRAYRPDELLKLARAAEGADGYVFDVQVAGAALCFTGRPA